METITDIEVRKVKQSKINEADFAALEFGKYVADHMLVCDYADSEWQQPMIVPFANLSTPSAGCVGLG